MEVYPGQGQFYVTGDRMSGSTVEQHYPAWVHFK